MGVLACSRTALHVSELRHALIPCCHSGSAREPAFSETLEKELIRCRGDTEPPTGPKVHPGCSLSLACVSEPREAAEVMSVECRRDTRRWNVGPIVPTPPVDESDCGRRFMKRQMLVQHDSSQVCWLGMGEHPLDIRGPRNVKFPELEIIRFQFPPNESRCCMPQVSEVVCA